MEYAMHEIIGLAWAKVGVRGEISNQFPIAIGTVIGNR